MFSYVYHNLSIYNYNVCTCNIPRFFKQDSATFRFSQTFFRKYYLCEFPIMSVSNEKTLEKIDKLNHLTVIIYERQLEMEDAE